MYAVFLTCHAPCALRFTAMHDTGFASYPKIYPSIIHPPLSLGREKIEMLTDWGVGHSLQAAWPINHVCTWISLTGNGMGIVILLQKEKKPLLLIYLARYRQNGLVNECKTTTRWGGGGASYPLARVL